MTKFNEYLTGEVVEDYAEGFISRREAMRQLGLLGIGVAVATPLLAACGTDKQDPVQTPTAGAGTASAPGTPAGPPPLPTQAITFDGPAGRTLQGAWSAAPGEAQGSVLVVHENRGLTDHIRSVAGRLAAAGYSALAVDLLSEEGGTAKFTDPAQATAALNAAPDERFVADMKAGVTELLRRVPKATPGAVGFCFGGGMVWSLLAAGESRLSAAAPFYGPLPEGADFAKSRRAAVLGVYAELDDRVNASRDAAEAALKKAGNKYAIKTYQGANHAFFNSTGQRYNPEAATAAYNDLIAWFTQHLKTGT